MPSSTTTNPSPGDTNTVWHAYRTPQGTLVVSDRLPAIQATQSILLPRAVGDASPGLLGQLPTLTQKNTIFSLLQKPQPYHVDLIIAFAAGVVASLVWRWLRVWRWLWRSCVIAILLLTCAFLYSAQRPMLLNMLATAKQHIPESARGPIDMLEQTQQQLHQLQQLSPKLDLEQKQRLEQLEQLE